MGVAAPNTAASQTATGPQLSTIRGNIDSDSPCQARIGAFQAPAKL